MKKPFEPNFRTPDEDLSKEELNKINKNNVFDQMYDEYRNDAPDLTWEAEQLSKSLGIYLEFNRALKGPEKDWSYMIRIANPGGGPINRAQWRHFDDMASKYTANPEGFPSLRLTTRQAIQYHWVKKHGVLDIVKTLAHADFRSLNACGDNTRNVMACPLARYSDIFNANEWAQKVGKYFELSPEPFAKIFEVDPNYLRDPNEPSFSYGSKMLNRKFKIAFSTVHKCQETGKIIYDNCVEALTNDLAIAPLVEHDKVVAFQIYIGGGQGERNGKISGAMLGQPLTIVTEDNLLKVMDAIVHVHQEWGDRQNRHWARLKYVVKKQGINWYRDQVSSRLGEPLEKPNLEHDIGPRHLHYGWTKQPSNGLWAYGLFVENGRLIDNSPNGELKKMVREIMDKYDIELNVTANQDIIFTNISDAAKEDFEADLESYGYGQRNGKTYSTLRKLSGACVGRDTCRLTYTDSEKFEPVLIDELEDLGWGDMTESIGITGCERQCFRPATKTIGLVGSGLDRYTFKLFGDETARFQGRPLIDSSGENLYLRSVTREQVPVVIDALFKDYKKNKQKDESLGAYHRRIGEEAIIKLLKENPDTAQTMERPFNTTCVLD